MKLFLDTSDVDEIRKHYETGLISGVTTNPSLILKSGGDPHETLTEISRIFPDDASTVSYTHLTLPTILLV